MNSTTLNLDMDAALDEDFFGNLERSRNNLKELFGDNESSGSSKNQSLKYQPPKKAQNESNSKKDSIAVTQEKWITKLAKVATAYRDGENMIGKVGIALLNNPENPHRRIIIYKTKSNILGTLSINSSLRQLHSKSNYLQFYDDANVFWSIHIDKEADRKEFFAALEHENINTNMEEDGNVSELSATLNTKVKNDSDDDSKELKNRKTSNIVENKETTTNPTQLPSSSRSSIVSRMAKMGGKALPILPSVSNNDSITATEYSDSSDTEVIITTTNFHKPQIVPRTSKTQYARSQLVPATINSSTIMSTTTTNGLLNQMESNLWQMMVSENRTQNTELRMNLIKLESKIEKVLDKVDLLGTNAAASAAATTVIPQTNKEDDILELEERILDLKKENRKLKLALQNNARRHSNAVSSNSMEGFHETLQKSLEIFEMDLQQFNVKISQTSDLDNIFKMFLEKLRIMERDMIETKDSNEKNCKALEDDVRAEREKCLKLTEKSNELTFQLDVLHSQIEALEGDKRSLNARFNETQEENSKLKVNVEALENANGNLKRDLEQEKSKHASLAKQHEQQQQQQQQGTNDSIKTIMNNLYAILSERIADMKFQESEKVVAVIGKTIREETLKSIQEQQ